MKAFCGKGYCLIISPLLKCVYYDIKLCRGPCTGKILPFTYTATVNEVVRFLNGNVNEPLHELKKELKLCINSLEFENAERIRRMIEFCMAYTKKSLYHNLFKTKTIEIYNKVTGEVKYSFYHGRMNYFADDTDKLPMESGILESEHQSFSDPRLLLDRIDIIYNWLNRHINEFEYHFR